MQDHDPGRAPRWDFRAGQPVPGLSKIPPESRGLRGYGRGGRLGLLEQDQLAALAEGSAAEGVDVDAAGQAGRIEGDLVAARAGETVHQGCHGAARQVVHGQFGHGGFRQGKGQGRCGVEGIGPGIGQAEGRGAVVRAGGHRGAGADGVIHGQGVQIVLGTAAADQVGIAVPREMQGTEIARAVDQDRVAAVLGMKLVVLDHHGPVVLEHLDRGLGRQHIGNPARIVGGTGGAVAAVGEGVARD